MSLLLLIFICIVVIFVKKHQKSNKHRETKRQFHKWFINNTTPQTSYGHLCSKYMWLYVACFFSCIISVICVIYTVQLRTVFLCVLSFSRFSCFCLSILSFVYVLPLLGEIKIYKEVFESRFESFTLDERDSSEMLRCRRVTRQLMQLSCPPRLL